MLSAPPPPQALPSIVVTDGEHVSAPLGRLVDELDVLFVLVDILQDIQAFGTVANLAAVDRLFKARLQPWMDKTKKRIVIDLDDLALRDTSNFKNVQCVQFLSSPSYGETLRFGKADDSFDQGHYLFPLESAARHLSTTGRNMASQSLRSRSSPLASRLPRRAHTRPIGARGNVLRQQDRSHTHH
jgi:hypothetical protein